MPSFFTFQQGSEQRSAFNNEHSPLLGRFRAVPDAYRLGRGRRRSLLGLEVDRFGIGFGAREDSDEGEVNGRNDEEYGAVKRWMRTMRDLWLEPKQGAVVRTLDKWWSRWTVLVILPAALTVAWCALPLPQYDFPDDDDAEGLPSVILGHRTPGHGEARVQINFWFFLFIYYGFYNVTALMWITKVFNIYSLNWWPQSLGFPLTVSIIAAMSIATPIPFYCIPELRFITSHNTAWICWTFFAMAMPLLVAFGILLNHERHLGLRNPLSETQRLFTSSWWTGDSDTIIARDRPHRPKVSNASVFNRNAPLEVALASDDIYRSRDAERILRKRWLPASFVRFLWFCAALSIAILTYLLGEAYAEIYLRTLPHDTVETLVYVYSWVVTVHVLDGICGWILGGNEGERVGSYPLGWVFKLYFALTYQTYVRALYARLRSPQEFVYLQIMSSSFLIILVPLTISKPFHSILKLLSINGQSYGSYQKFCTRNIFIRGLSENVSMLAFLGSILVLHYGSNKDVYPYFAFDNLVNQPSNSTTNATTATYPFPSLPSRFPSVPHKLPVGGPIPSNSAQYDFRLTFYASIVTWACEIVAGWITRRLLWLGWKMDVTGEGKKDLGSWPELLPTGVVVMVHVLQNMLFSIVRLAFK